MAGIYIHIPFCKQACSYCNFHFSTSLLKKDDFLQALIKEITLRAKDWQDMPIDTIYFGGGTPSLLTGKDLNSIFKALHTHFNLSSLKESTLEANPDDLSSEKLKILADSPINRLSIGIQSFHNKDLKYMNRAHSSSEAHRSIELAHQLGFEQLTVDLIYGTPGLSNEDWISNLNTVFQYDIPHLSCYALTIEPRTALHHNIKVGKSQAPDDNAAADHFKILQSLAADCEYEHYEISNFAKDQHYALHNTSYWFGQPYLGLGPSAHSYDGQNRYWNVANNPKYINALNNGHLAQEEERLTNKDRYNEAVLCRLRTKWGIDKDDLDGIGAAFASYFQEEVKNYISTGHIEHTESNYRLSPTGLFIADKITSDLFYLD